MSATKTQWMTQLQAELEDAEERKRRWADLGRLFGKSLDKSWQATAELRNCEVEQLKLLIERVQAED